MNSSIFGSDNLTLSDTQDTGCPIIFDTPLLQCRICTFPSVQPCTCPQAKVTFVLGNLRQFHVKWKEVEGRLPEHTRGRLVQGEGEGEGEEQGEVEVQVVQEVQGKVLVQ